MTTQDLLNRINNEIQRNKESEGPVFSAEDRRLFGELAAGRHFTTFPAEWIARMRRIGIIKLSRPYSDRKYCSVGIMPGVPGITDDKGWPID